MRKTTLLAVLAGVVFLGAGCQQPAPAVLAPQTSNPSSTMQLTSDAFQQDGMIPARFTCDGQNISPALHIADVPDGAQSLVLIMEDPDVPKNLRPEGVFDHWLAWNIPPSTTSIAEGTEPSGVIGNTTSGKTGYTGPCPPDKEHRYFFRLYAIDTTLDLPQTVSKNDLVAAIKGHVLASVELLGHYDRPRS